MPVKKRVVKRKPVKRRLVKRRPIKRKPVKRVKRKLVKKRPAVKGRSTSIIDTILSVFSVSDKTKGGFDKKFALFRNLNTKQEAYLKKLHPVSYWNEIMEINSEFKDDIKFQWEAIDESFWQKGKKAMPYNKFMKL